MTLCEGETCTYLEVSGVSELPVAVRTREPGLVGVSHQVVVEAVLPGEGRPAQGALEGPEAGVAPVVSEESAVDHSIILPPGEVAMRLDRVPMLQSDRVTSPMAALLQHTTYIITSHHIYLMKSLTFRTFV